MPVSRVLHLGPNAAATLSVMADTKLMPVSTDDEKEKKEDFDDYHVVLLGDKLLICNPSLPN